MSQISLPLEWPGQGPGAGPGSGPGGSAAAFLLSEANRIAAAHIENWRDWPLMVSILTGPPRSGRSTLGRHFAAMSGGTLIDDARGLDERMLFNAWNRAVTDRVPLLLIADTPPAGWTIALPDLRSRLAAAPHVAITEPDEALARALMERNLAAAGVAFSGDLIDWLLRRIERSYGAIATVTRLLDRAALSSGRKISVALAKETLHRDGFLPIVPLDSPTQPPSE